jgi:hypothetical protein
MTEANVEIDMARLDKVRAILGTGSVGETIDAALGEVIRAAAARHLVPPREGHLVSPREGRCVRLPA